MQTGYPAKTRLGDAFKSIRRKLKSDTRLIVKLMLPVFILFFLINAAAGFYTLTGLSRVYDDSVESLDTVRNAQVHLYRQLVMWQKILLNAGDPERFRKSFHDFSYCAQDTQNALGNLKLQLVGSEELSREADRIIQLHGELTSDYTEYVTEMDDSSAADVSADSLISKGRDRRLVDSMNALGKAIESGQAESTARARRSFIRSSVSICAFLVVLMIFFGRNVGKRLVQTHETLEAEVKKRTEELEETNRRVMISEKKYRSLVEGTGEVIFTLDPSLAFTSVNGAAKTALRISPQKLTGMRLFDLIHDGSVGTSVSGAIIAESLAQCRTECRPFHFNAALKTAGLIEAVNFDITIEFLGESGCEEIMGRAVPATGDRISGCCTFEKGRYVIGNQLIEAEEVSFRVTEKLSNFLPASDVSLLKMGVREMLINAIEHGNLGVTFAQKSAAMEQERYFQLINERQNDPANSAKKVVIDYVIDENHTAFRITDDGDGFDHRKMMERAASQNEDGALPHGRGITLIRSIFDRVTYNAKGNQILLEKTFAESA